jgi:hypothetical protein
MKAFEGDERLKTLRLRWFWTLLILWEAALVGFTLYETFRILKKPMLENSLSGMAGGGGRSLVITCGCIMFGLLGIPFVFALAHGMAKLQIALLNTLSDARQNRQDKLQAKQARREDERVRRDFEKNMKVVERESTEQAALAKNAQSKQHFIVRLGAIDNFIRVMGTEQNDSKRTMAMQSAHSQMTALAADLASGKISRDMIADPDIQEQARETSRDLVRLGLTDDRLNRDIKRIFQLK